MTNPNIIESRRFFMFILWTKLDIKGNRLDISLNLVCRRLNDCLCVRRCSLVSIAMLIWSFIKELELLIWLLSFKYISLLLNPELDGLLRFVDSPEPRSNSSRSIRVVWLAHILLNSCRYPWRISRCRCKVCIAAAPEVGSSDMFSFNDESLSNIWAISSESESKTCSPRRGDVSAELWPAELDEPAPILLNATSFKSISFSRCLACLRSAS